MGKGQREKVDRTHWPRPSAAMLWPKRRLSEAARSSATMPRLVGEEGACRVPEDEGVLECASDRFDKLLCDLDE